VWTGARLSATWRSALVAHDHGQDVALRVARRLVIYLKRPGGQSRSNVSLDQVATVMGHQIVRNCAGDGVLINDFTGSSY
jgi:transcriptional regulator GlxA family with amidase domain